MGKTDAALEKRIGRYRLDPVQEKGNCNANAGNTGLSRSRAVGGGRVRGRIGFGLLGRRKEVELMAMLACGGGGGGVRHLGLRIETAAPSPSYP